MSKRLPIFLLIGLCIAGAIALLVNLFGSSATLEARVKNGLFLTIQNVGNTPVEIKGYVINDRPLYGRSYGNS
jgi:hypothetical protein